MFSCSLWDPHQSATSAIHALSWFATADACDRKACVYASVSSAKLRWLKSCWAKIPSVSSVYAMNVFGPNPTMSLVLRRSRQQPSPTHQNSGELYMSDWTGKNETSRVLDRWKRWWRTSRRIWWSTVSNVLTLSRAWRELHYRRDQWP